MADESQPTSESNAAGWRLLGTRDFGCLWAGQVISQIGDGLNKVALLWFVYELTGSALKMTAIGLLQNFITKPVRFDDLLDWLGARLSLQWQAAPNGDAGATAPPQTPAAAVPVAPPLPAPSRAQLLALQQVVELGYPRGVMRLLDEIEQARPECHAWLAPLRQLAQAFEFDRMTPRIRDAIAHAHPA